MLINNEVKFKNIFQFKTLKNDKYKNNFYIKKNITNNINAQKIENKEINEISKIPIEKLKLNNKIQKNPIKNTRNKRNKRINLQFIIQIRNQLISAYKEIMNIQV